MEDRLLILKQHIGKKNQTYRAVEWEERLKAEISWEAIVWHGLGVTRA